MLRLVTSACLAVAAVTSGCALTKEEIAEHRRNVETQFSRTFETDAPTTTVVATAPRVEQRDNMTAGVGVAGSSAVGVGVGVANSRELLMTRAYEARIEALEGGRCRVTMSPTIRVGEQDITVRTVNRGARVERARIDEIMNAALRFMRP
jgi:hypothetical protein